MELKVKLDSLLKESNVKTIDGISLKNGIREMKKVTSFFLYYLYSENSKSVEGLTQSIMSGEMGDTTGSQAAGIVHDLVISGARLEFKDYEFVSPFRERVKVDTCEGIRVIPEPIQRKKIETQADYMDYLQDFRHIMYGYQDPINGSDFGVNKFNGILSLYDDVNSNVEKQSGDFSTPQNIVLSIKNAILKIQQSSDDHFSIFIPSQLYSLIDTLREDGSGIFYKDALRNTTFISIAPKFLGNDTTLDNYIFVKRSYSNSTTQELALPPLAKYKTNAKYDTNKSNSRNYNISFLAQHTDIFSLELDNLCIIKNESSFRKK